MCLPEMFLYCSNSAIREGVKDTNNNLSFPVQMIYIMSKVVIFSRRHSKIASGFFYTTLVVPGKIEFDT